MIWTSSDKHESSVLSRILHGEGAPVAPWLGYVLAVIIFVIALAGRFAMLPAEGGSPFVTFYPAVAVCAMLLGMAPGLLAVVLCAVTSEYFFLAPFRSFLLNPSQIAPLVLFISSGGLICFIGRQMRHHAMALRDSEQRFRLLASATFEGIAMTEQGRFIDANEQLLTMFGYTREALIGMPMAALLPPHERERLMDSVLSGNGERYLDMLRHDGTLIQVEVHGQDVSRDGRSVRITALRDVSERQRAEHLLRIAATAFEAQEGMVVTDADNVILRVNRAFSDITGYTPEEVVGRKMSMFKSGRHDAAFYDAMWESIGRSGTWQGEILNRRKNGELYPEWLTITAVRDAGGTINNYVGTLTDITQRKAVEDEVKHLAFYDVLTGLPNRRLLLNRLQQALASSARSGRNGALLFIDVDNFKVLNDTLGHDIGDLLLQQIAQRLSACVREGDTVARLGGDEFVVMLEGLSEHAHEVHHQIERICDKVLANFKQPFQLGPHQCHNTSSIGATLFCGHQCTVDELMKRADLAMYEAKSAGRNTLRFFDPQMQAAITARAALERSLRQGLQQQEFVLYYQCQVDGQGAITGAEALIRWQHPEQGLMSPATFIPLAEETGLILPLGHWVLETACTCIAAWAAVPAMAHLTLAINVSARQFRHPDFVTQVLDALAHSGADARKLKLELTESLLLDDVEDTIAKMSALKEQGVGFSLDDFGTGYSSLSYLKRLPLDQLKIDQSFVRDILTDANDAAITRTIVALAHSMGLHVIAEGVELAVPRDILLQQGCAAFQGYLFSQPLPLAQFEQLLPALP